MNVRALLSTSIVLTCFFVGTHGVLVFAEGTSTAPEIPPTLPADVAPSKEDTDAAARKEARRVEFRTAVAPLVKTRTQNLLENVVNRLMASASRMERIALRIKRRAEKQEQNGFDARAVHDALREARASVSTATAALTRATDFRMAQIVDSSSPHAGFMTLANELRATAAALTTAREHLRTALALLSATSEREATSSPETL